MMIHDDNHHLVTWISD